MHTQKHKHMYADAGFWFGADTLGFSRQPPLDFSFPPLGPDDACIYGTLIANSSTYLGNMGQPSLISEYDFGGEGDLFKVPEFITEEPLLSLDPVSMMSGGDISIIENDPLLSQVLHECEIEEAISELLDFKIAMPQVEQLPGQAEEPLAIEKDKSSSPAEFSLHKSVSLNSADSINGTVRPNFLDFQGLDFETAFGLRRTYSEGGIKNLGANIPRPGNSANDQTYWKWPVTISGLKTEERKQKLSRYRKKKIERNFGRKIKYACRKVLADSLPRVRGRFVKMDECDLLKPRK